MLLMRFWKCNVAQMCPGAMMVLGGWWSGSRFGITVWGPVLAFSLGGAEMCWTILQARKLGKTGALMTLMWEFQRCQTMSHQKGSLASESTYFEEDVVGEILYIGRSSVGKRVGSHNIICRARHYEKRYTYDIYTYYSTMYINLEIQIAYFIYSHYMEIHEIHIAMFHHPRCNSIRHIYI